MSSGIKQLSKDTIIYGLGSTIHIISAFILVPIVTRLFGVHDYGIIDLSQTFIQLYIIFFAFSLTTAISFFYYEDDDEKERKLTVSTTIYFLLFVNLTLGIIFLFFSNSLSSLLFAESGHQQIFRILILISIINIFYNLFLHLLRITKQPWKYIFNSSTKLVIDLGLILLFVFVIARGELWGYFIALVISLFITTIQLIWFNRRYLDVRFSLNRLKKLLRYSLPIIPAAMAMWALSLLNRFFLTHYSGLEQVGIYSIGVKSAILITLLVTAFQLAWPPYAFSVMKQDNARQIYARILVYFSVIGIWLVLISSVLSRVGILMIATPDYLEASSTTPWLALGIFFLGSYAIVSIGINIIKKIKYIAYTSILAAILNLILNIILIPKYGILGASIATLISYLAALLIVYKYAQKYYTVPYNKLSFIGVIAIGISLIIIDSILSEVIGDTITLYLLKLILIVSFPIIIVRTNIINKKEKEAILSNFKRLINNFKHEKQS